jgi:transposase
LGSIPAQQQRVSLALKEPVEATQNHVQKQTAVNVDETGWYEMAKDFWLWVCTTPDVSVFRIFDSRSGSGAKMLLGENYLWIVGTDRFSGYSWINPSHRQVCWAHFKRDSHWSSVGMNPRSLDKCYSLDSKRSLACGIVSEKAHSPVSTSKR